MALITPTSPRMDGTFVHIFESMTEWREKGECGEGRFIDSLLNVLHIGHNFHIVKGFRDFLAAWRQACATAKIYKTNILHWSSHGFPPTVRDVSAHEGGVSLASGATLPWHTFQQLLAMLPRSKNREDRLILCMSSCYGAEFAEEVRNLDYPFFDYLIGSDRPICFDDASVGFATFYYQVRNHVGIPEAVDKMNESLVPKQCEGYSNKKLFTLICNENFCRYS